MADERRLIAQLQSSSTREKAFTALIHLYQEQLYWQIRRLVISHEDADDVLQNTLMKAWNNIDSFRGDAKISTWLFRIAVNEALGFIEKKKRTTNICADESEFVQQLISDTYFDGDETQMQLQEAVHNLPEKQRLVFTMKYFQEMKYEEISSILGTTVGALKASYHIAVRKITEYFEQHD